MPRLRIEPATLWFAGRHSIHRAATVITEAVLYLWLHSGSFTDLGTILLQGQRFFPGFSRPNVKMDSFTTQLGGSFVPGRGLLWDSIMSKPYHPSSLTAALEV